MRYKALKFENIFLKYSISAFWAVLQIIFEFFSEILEVLLDTFGAVIRHGLGPGWREFCGGVKHDIMNVAGDDHVVYRDLITTYEFELRFLLE